MTDLVQYQDGSLALRNNSDGLDLGRWGGPKTPTGAQPRWGGDKTAKVPLAAIDTAGGVFAFPNPEGAAVLVTRVLLDVTAQSAGACTVSVGTAASGTTSGNNLVDALSVAAAGIFDNVTDKGVSGKTRQRLAAGSFVTGSVATGASAGLAGNVYLTYCLA